MKKLLSRKILLMSLLLMLGGALLPSLANAYVLTSGNSTATVTNTQAGMYEWIVDRVDQMGQQWFWYRIGSTPERSIDTLALNSTFQLPNLLQLNYSGASFDLGVTYVLTGGLLGSGTSDMAEIISISNTSNSTLDFHFFQYTDFDLRGHEGDTVSISGGNTAKQVGQGIVTETANVPIPSRLEAALWPSTISKLNDGVASNLNNDAGPYTGDATWAFQWDFNLGPGGSFIISKNKHISTVPLPGTMLLLGGGLLGLVGLGWRRRRS